MTILTAKIIVVIYVGIRPHIAVFPYIFKRPVTFHTLFGFYLIGWRGFIVTSLATKPLFRCMGVVYILCIISSSGKHGKKNEQTNYCYMLHLCTLNNMLRSFPRSRKFLPWFLFCSVCSRNSAEYYTF